jgi:plastocyanin
MNVKKSVLVMAFLSVFILAGTISLSFAAAPEVFEIQIKDHMFSPEELIVPANTRIKLVVENLDPTPEEFESHDLNREKIITGNGKIFLFVGPLKPGEYKYFGEFHEDTAQGLIIAQAAEEIEVQ